MPRYEELVHLPDGQKAGKTLIGYDEVETLDFEPAKLRVHAKYADPGHPQRGVQAKRFDGEGIEKGVNRDD